MPRGWINEETAIGLIIRKKGKKAKDIMNGIICDGEKGCYLATEVKLGAAMELKEKKHLLPDILTKLNNIPNISPK